MRLLAPLLLALSGAFTCTKPAPAPEPAPGPTVPGGAVDPGPAPDPATPATCLSNADCNGGVCEGKGCSDDQPGTCAPPDRVCTRDARPYCGCDGQTFTGSGSCPGQRFAHEGECEAAGTAPGGDGSPCLAASDCQSGVCEGQGCGDDQPGECKPAARACTRDLRPYCGCDGQTFRSSGSCPGQRYSAADECAAPSKGDGAKKKKSAKSDAKAP